MKSPHQSLSQLTILGACAVLMLGTAACGGDDNENKNGAGTDAQSSEDSEGSSPDGKRTAEGQDTGPTFSGDREEAEVGATQIENIYKDFNEAVEAGVAATDVPAGNTLEAANDIESLTDVCDLMSEKAKQQTIIYAKRSAGLADVKWTCENSTGLLLRRAKQTGGLKRSLRAEIIGVNAVGDRATASVRFGDKGPISSLPLVKEDGEWKLGANVTNKPVKEDDFKTR